MKKALFPGSFDPVTNGHLDVIERASKLFDILIVSVALNESKCSLFSIPERKEYLKIACEERGMKNIEIASFKGLLIDAVRKMKVDVVVRGLRAFSDFEFEFQLALMNRELEKTCETIFLMPSPEYTFVSSRMVKEIAKFGGDISAFVPPVVKRALKKKRTV